MYADELTQATIPFEDIYLDPNNPRFWAPNRISEVTDARTIRDNVQASTSARINSHGIDELRNSILRNGFLPLDRIVVRPLQDIPNKYVVIEGNRRLAALRRLRQEIRDHDVAEDDIDDSVLEKLESDTDLLTVLVYGGSEKTTDISWRLQGIRHIGGIRDWDAAQRAKLVVDQVENANGNRGFRDVGQSFGLTPQAVGRLYRGYKALRQMRQDEEYGQYAKTEFFTLLDEAHRRRTVRDWMDWREDPNDRSSWGYHNIDNRRRFYAWISPDPDNNQKRRIHNPTHVRYLDALLKGGHDSLIDLFDEHELTIDEAFLKASGTPDAKDYLSILNGALESVRSLPIHFIRSKPSELGEVLDDMIRELKEVRDITDRATPEGTDATE